MSVEIDIAVSNYFAGNPGMGQIILRQAFGALLFGSPTGVARIGLRRWWVGRSKWPCSPGVERYIDLRTEER